MTKKEVKGLFSGYNTEGYYNFNPKNYNKRKINYNDIDNEGNDYRDEDGGVRNSRSNFGKGCQDRHANTGVVLFNSKKNDKLKKLKMENETLKDCLLRIEKDHQEDLSKVTRGLR